MSESNNNFDFLVEYITAFVVERIMQDQGVGLEQALVRFHNSETFAVLSKPDTAMYIESPRYVYEVYQAERQRGTIRGLSE